MKYILFKFIFILYSFYYYCYSWKIKENEKQLVEQLIRNCNSSLFQNQTYDSYMDDIACGKDCQIEQHAIGCSLLENALTVGCQKSCNITEGGITRSSNVFCSIGCEEIINGYFNYIKGEATDLKEPIMVENTLTSSSLNLQWEDNRYRNESFSVQCKNIDLGDMWLFCQNQFWMSSNTVQVKNLHPFTKYQFRIAIQVIPGGWYSLYTEPSPIIATLPSNLPSSAPRILRATIVDCNMVSVLWQQQDFPSSPIVSYIIRTNELPAGIAAVKDIPVTENTHSYMLQNLQPSKNYSISVSARNSLGLGPSASVALSLPECLREYEIEDLNIMIASQNTIYVISSEIDSEPVVMYNTTHTIKGIALHIHRELVFICDSSGSILVTSSKGMLTPHEILPVGSEKPVALTIDWLSDHIYILSEVVHPSGTIAFQVSRCGLDGSNLIVVILGFMMKPNHIEVDPYNGYLFWVVRGIGLYRLDLNDISKLINQNVSPDLIIEDANLGAFTIDYNHFRILITSHSQNAIISSSLNGQDVVNFRSNVHGAQFQNVNSLTMLNGLLYWSDNDEVYGEIYDANTDVYSHQKLLNESSAAEGCISVLANMLSTQPIPIPLNPPTNFQVIFGYDIAKVSWNIPHHLAGQGSGAWSSWSYRLLVQYTNRSEFIDHYDIKWTQFTVTDLKPATEYIMKIAAYTTSGQGPWSDEFFGRTISRNVSLLWSSQNGLLITDITGYKVKKMEAVNSLEATSRFIITHIDWYKDVIYVSTNSREVYQFNISSNTFAALNEITEADFIAIEWIGKKIYWANRQQKLIFRSDLNGKHQEILPIIVAVKSMLIDSPGAYLYWSTGDKIERAHFDGTSRNVFFSVSNLFASTVIGLSLDLTVDRLYWVMRYNDNPKHILLTVDPDLAAKKSRNITTVINRFNLTETDIIGDICNVDEQLIYIRKNDKNAMISRLNGSTSTFIHSESLSDLTTCATFDPSTRIISNDELLSSGGEINVLPDKVLASSIQIEGSYDLFNITWSPITNVNYGTVSYRVRIVEQQHDTTTIREEPYITIGNSKAYIPLMITIQPKTYWATADPVNVTLYSPPTAPSRPTHLRVFIAHSKRNPTVEEKEVTGVFRWSSPVQPNGIIQHYDLSCLILRKDQNYSITTFSSSRLSGKILEHVFHKLPINNFYIFTVRACTQVGCGPSSSTTEINIENESPVPKLLVITGHGLSIMDYDRMTFGIAITGTINITAAAYNGQENVVYWIENNRIYQSNLQWHLVNKKQVTTLNGKGHSLVLDWVAKILYWVQCNDTYSKINSLDLSYAENKRITKTILSRPTNIDNLLISPLHSLLIWVEISNEHYTGNTLMKSGIDGTNVKQFFAKPSAALSKTDIHPLSSNDEQEKSCNCSFGPFVGTAITLLPSSSVQNGYKLLWVDFLDSNVIVSDMDGCYCSVLIRCTHTREHGLPPDSLTADFQRLYWIDSGRGTLYVTYRDEHYQIDKIKMNGVVEIKEILSFGTHLQQFPPLHCLWPTTKAGVAHLIKHTSDMIVLQLPLIERKRNCSSVSIATIEYTLYYGIIKDDGTSNCTINTKSCLQLVSYERTIKVTNLKPFTRYVFMVGITNYYARLRNMEPLIGIPAVYRTSPGVPSAPRNITALPISPNGIFIKWSPSEEINAESVWYEIYWRSGAASGEHVVPSMISTSTTIDGLLPNTDYFIKVRAYAHRSNNYSQSEEIKVTTYSEPQNLELINSTARSLILSLPSDLVGIRYEVETYDSLSNEWYQIPKPKDISYVISKDLRPMTSYSFRLKIWYTGFHSPYIWPLDKRFTFQTEGDIPDKPGVPIHEYLKNDSVKLHWDMPYSNNNGAKIIAYCLEAKIIQKTEDEVNTNNNWTIYYNGTETSWICSNLKYNTKYRFRVKAKNKYGWSDYSGLSELIELISKNNYSKIIIFWFTIPLFGVVTVAVLTVCIYVRKCRDIQEKPNNLEKTGILSNSSRNGEFELANLREMPSGTGGNILRNINALYSMRFSVAISTNEDDIDQLPRISRDQIKLTKFLGSGAFGEVYEGTVMNLIYENVETKVAVKSLRKNATEQEKVEFLKEAQLMSNFKHNHILQMLAVCVDNNPRYIIMELMEGGDLLTFLRSNRASSVSGTGSLTISDLINICVDVASGCKYLEEMHFVHRDLACRNCLVSSKDPEFRVVKIGDFGLARDIYKNDYYRKEGEGLLPVRWMAPESIMDGVFTRQSDVWSFGILLWEVMSLGQQPYPARSNVEVLQYVRTGGRLPRPTNCIPTMYELMVKCWNFLPKNRPTFVYCLSTLENLRDKICSSPPSAINYATLVPVIADDKNGSETFKKNQLAVSEKKEEQSHNE